MSMFTRFKPYHFVLLIFIFIAVISSPFWLWHLKSNENVDILILDKTVQNESYREHEGLIWALNHQKIKKSSGGAYEAESDFVRAIPSYTTQQRNPAYIYLADSYGVETVQKNRRPSVKGGLSEEDVQNVRDLLFKGKTNLIAEFNVFATPTSLQTRKEISELLNVKWTGWIGRYFQQLEGGEVPSWMKENYADRYGTKWNHQGGGLLFIHENGEMIVLQDSELTKDGVQFSFTQTGKDLYDLHASVPYPYWFDVIEAADENEITAKYTINVTPSGEKKLNTFGLASTFPAIIHHRNAKYESYYFAGDYADKDELPGLYKTTGISWIKEHFMLDDGRGSSFYWKVYLPLMKTVLNSEKREIKAEKVEIVNKEDIRINAKTGRHYLQIQKNGKWEDILIKGVNMGIAKPGYFPGETAIKKEEYYRWFKQIGAMNANALRVYTIHPPAFYEAFYEYNQTAKTPLYLFHGVWVNEDELKEKQDVFAQAVTTSFKKEIKNVVDIINGSASIPKKAGHAGGEYRHNISKYLLGYILGVEWDPEVTVNSNKKHSEITSYKGSYFSALKASPMESWLAEMMDYTAAYETKTYNWQHPVSHVNWVTTDLLKHPSEPFEKEDMVAINPNVIQPEERFHSGYFASYHIYPYYPDFLNYEKKYTEYADHRGEKNNYAGYLNDMKRVHDMPLLVAEFGVPSSRGITHENVYGLDQGHHSEKEQGKMDVRLFEDIVEEKMAGGMVFTWQDEWFKRTWNTMDFDNPDRRPYWPNAQTNEQQFGLLSFDPSGKTAITADGQTEDWFGIKPVESSQKSDQLKALYLTSDVRYLYMRIDYSGPINKNKLKTGLLIDTLPNQGQEASPDGKVKLDRGAEFSISLTNKKDSRILVDSYYDSFYYMYAHQLNMLKKKEYVQKKNNGIYHPLLMALNKELTIPNTKEVIPFQSYDTGKLQFGTANPKSEEYHSLTDVSVNEEKGIVELRIPWLLLGVKDPSLHEIIGDLWRSGLKGSTTSSGIRAAVYTTDAAGKLENSLPASKDGKIPLNSQSPYKWDEWDDPQYEERLKQSYYILQKGFQDIDKLKE